MDPLSITASTIAIFTAVNQAVKAAKAFHNAPEQVDSLLNDLADTEIMVRTVESSLQNQLNLAKIPRDQLEGVCRKLAKSKETLLNLEVLVRVQVNERGSMPTYKRAAWLMAKNKAAKVKQKLDTVCDELRCALGQFKTSCIELELQHVSVVVSETVETQNRTEEQGDNIACSVNEILRSQQQEFDAMREGQEEIIESTHAALSASTQILEKFESIEKFFLTEQIPPKRNSLMIESVESISNDPTHHNEKRLENIELMRTKTTTTKYRRVAVQARYRQPFQCTDDCPCNCHAKSKINSPDGLRSLLGQLFVGYNGLPVVKNACSYPKCARKKAFTSSVTYFFPHWWVAQRMLSLVVKMMALGGPEVIMKFPRIVPATARIFRHCNLAEVDSLRALFATGLGSPADTDTKTGATPLHYAYASGNEETIKYLLHRGADRNAKNFAGLSPTEEAWTGLLTNSVTSTHRKIFEGICDEETLEEFNFTDLHQSVIKISSRSVEEELKALTRSSATIDDTDAAGRTALSWAAQSGDAETMRILLEFGADPNKATPGSKHSLHYTAGVTASAECTKILLDFGADVHARDDVGLTPLIWGTINVRGNYSNLETLLDRSDTELADQNGRTAIFHAASASVIPTNMLLSKGCNLNHMDDEGFSALHLAISYNRAEVIRTLVESGIDYHCRLPTSNQGILHHAAYYAEIESVEALLAVQLVNLDINVKDNDGCTPIDLLETRVPEPSPKVFVAFHRLLEQIEARTAFLDAKTDVVSESDSLLEFETASEASFSEEAHAKQ